MDRNSKIFFIVFVSLIAISVAATFWRTIIKRDYIIEAQADCDPSTEMCFVWTCDPELLEEGEVCSGDPAEDVSIYKILRRNASHIPLCDPVDENCRALVCEPNEDECEYIYCNEENKIEQEAECNDPATYVETISEDGTEVTSDCSDADVCTPPDTESLDATSTESLSNEGEFEEEIIPDKVIFGEIKDDDGVVAEKVEVGTSSEATE